MGGINEGRRLGNPLGATGIVLALALLAAPLVGQDGGLEQLWSHDTGG